MYAVRRWNVRNLDSTQKRDRFEVRVTLGGKALKGLPPERITELSEEVMYWRKANHIHNWFVRNVQGGRDNCATYHVDYETLDQLHRDCAGVILASELVDGMIELGIQYSKEHPDGLPIREPGRVIKDITAAERLLPTVSGFFFGSTAYDERYLDEVQRTAEWAARMLADSEGRVPADIYYSSSW